MNKNVLIVLIGGFVVAILVAVLVQASLGGKTSEDSGEKLQVLVAAKDLPIGKNLAAGDLKWQTWPGQPFSGAIVRNKEEKSEDVLKGRLTTRVATGQPVLASYTFKEGRGNIVAATLEKGMRAVAIPVKANTMAGGFISPGDHVDVILTYTVEVDNDAADAKMIVKRHASETILKNIKILAVDQESSREEDSAKVAKTVTVEVDTSGAEKLALAAEMGDLVLSLRGLGDDNNTGTSDYTTDIQSSKIMQSVAIMENGGASGAVKIYNGSEIVEQRPRNPAVVIGGSSSQQPTTNTGSASTDLPPVPGAVTEPVIDAVEGGE